MRHSKLLAIAVCALACLTIAALLFFRDDVRISIGAALCTLHGTSVTEEGGCWDTFVTNEYKTHGLASALHAVDLIYREYPAFLESNCHQHAHLVGDLAYYQDSAEDPNFINTVQVPEDAVACGYGFFAGFIEHLIQNHPSAEFFESTCTSFIARWGTTMPGIRHMCYHAGAHGFLLAVVDHAKPSMYGDFHAFTDSTLAICASLHDPRNAESCRQGVFHQIYLWKDSNEYGFVSDRPSFSFCDTQSKELIHACYFNLAQGFAPETKNDPAALANITAHVSDPKLHRLLFEVGMWNMVPSFIFNDPTMTQLMSTCTSFGSALEKECIGGILAGYYIYGTPQEEYKKASDFCTSAAVSKDGLEGYCLRANFAIATLNYPATKMSAVCQRFPSEFRFICSEPIVPDVP